MLCIWRWPTHSCYFYWAWTNWDFRVSWFGGWDGLVSASSIVSHSISIFWRLSRWISHLHSPPLSSKPMPLIWISTPPFLISIHCISATVALSHCMILSVPPLASICSHSFYPIPDSMPPTFAGGIPWLTKVIFALYGIAIPICCIIF